MTPAHAAPLVSRARAGPILALDYGRRRIGAAVSDDFGISIRTLPVIERKNREQAIREIAAIVRRNNARLIVIGLPLRLSGTKGEMADEAVRFAQRLGKHLSIPVELQDERLTSWEAAQMRPEGAGKKIGAEKLDSLAAAIILRDFLAGHPEEQKL